MPAIAAALPRIGRKKSGRTLSATAECRSHSPLHKPRPAASRCSRENRKRQIAASRRCAGVWPLHSRSRSRVIEKALRQHRWMGKLFADIIALCLLHKNVGCIFSGDSPEGGESKLGKINSGKQMFPLAQKDWRHGQMHFVDLPGDQILANDGHATPNSDVLALGSLFRFLQSRLQSIGNEVERRATLHHEGRPRMMREHENGSVVRRIVAPPPLPGIVFRRPGPSTRAKYIPPQDPGADIFERGRGDIVVDSFGTAALAVHLLEDFGLLKPGMQFEPADSERVLQVLPGSGAEAVDG